jgi:hypothetical protein
VLFHLKRRPTLLSISLLSVPFSSKSINVI